MFGTPRAALAAGGSSRDQSAAPLTGGSTGRKSVRFTDDNTALTPAPDRANGTPNPNTAHAGHTPAPAGFGRFAADTPGGNDMPTPVYKFPGSVAGTPADASSTPADRGGRSMFGSAATPAAGAGGSGAGGQTPGSTGGFAFGSGGFGTPVAAAEAEEADQSPKAKGGTVSPLLAFNTPVSTGAGAAGEGTHRSGNSHGRTG
jgi:hypothetical protein